MKSIITRKKLVKKYKGKASIWIKLFLTCVYYERLTAYKNITFKLGKIVKKPIQKTSKGFEILGRKFKQPLKDSKL